jgi:hypothetical protein
MTTVSTLQRQGQIIMKSSVIPADAGYSASVVVQPSGGVEEESPNSIPRHPLGIKPLGNQYTAASNGKGAIGPLKLLPDEVLAILLEYIDSFQLCLLGSTCKFLYAFCRSDDLWKTLFIEYVYPAPSFFRAICHIESLRLKSD